MSTGFYFTKSDGNHQALPVRGSCLREGTGEPAAPLLLDGAPGRRGAASRVMDFLGHSRKGMPVTFRVYGHVTGETFEHARRAVDKTLFRLHAVASAGTVAELRAAR